MLNSAASGSRSWLPIPGSSPIICCDKLIKTSLIVVINLLNRDEPARHGWWKLIDNFTDWFSFHSPNIVITIGWHSHPSPRYFESVLVPLDVWHKRPVEENSTWFTGTNSDQGTGRKRPADPGRVEAWQPTMVFSSPRSRARRWARVLAEQSATNGFASGASSSSVS